MGEKKDDKKSKAKSGVTSKAKPKIKSQKKSGAKGATKKTTKAKVKSKTQAKAKSKAKPKAKTTTKVKSKTRPKVKTTAKAKSKAKPKSKIITKAKLLSEDEFEKHAKRKNRKKRKSIKTGEGEERSLRNRFLLAMPNMLDPNFDRAVILICEHTDEGALGIIINQPISITFDEVLEHMKLETEDQELKDLPVVFGGPVQQERGFIIHTPVGEWKASLPISENIAVTASRDVIEAIVKGEGPEQVLACLGYAGWGAGQLEEELANNLWIDCPTDLKVIFDLPFSRRWKAAGDLMGIDLTHISGDVGHA